MENIFKDKLSPSEDCNLQGKLSKLEEELEVEFLEKLSARRTLKRSITKVVSENLSIDNKEEQAWPILRDIKCLC